MPRERLLMLDASHDLVNPAILSAAHCEAGMQHGLEYLGVFAGLFTGRCEGTQSLDTCNKRLHTVVVDVLVPCEVQAAEQPPLRFSDLTLVQHLRRAYAAQWQWSHDCDMTRGVCAQQPARVCALSRTKLCARARTEWAWLSKRPACSAAAMHACAKAPAHGCQGSIIATMNLLPMSQRTGC